MHAIRQLLGKNLVDLALPRDAAFAGEGLGDDGDMKVGLAAFAPSLWAGGGLALAGPALAGLLIFGGAGLLTARLAGPRILAAPA